MKPTSIGISTTTPASAAVNLLYISFLVILSDSTINWNFSLYIFAMVFCFAYCFCLPKRQKTHPAHGSSPGKSSADFMTQDQIMNSPKSTETSILEQQAVDTDTTSGSAGLLATDAVEVEKSPKDQVSDNVAALEALLKDTALNQAAQHFHDVDEDPIRHDVKVLKEFIDERLMNGFVEQLGPNCGAASVAGALNALSSLNAEDKGCFSQQAAMAVYITKFQSTMATKQNKFKKVAPKHLTQSEINDLISVACSDSAVAVCKKADDKAKYREVVISSLRDTEEGSRGLVNDECGSNLADMLENEATPAISLLWKELKSVSKTQGALNKLQGEKPGTAPVGNPLLSKAVVCLGASRSINSSCTGFMGLSSTTCLHKVSAKDGMEEIENQWYQLTRAIEDPKRVLLFHLRNHYALVAGYRILEVKDDDGCTRELRQILCARRGQRPKHWIELLQSWIDDVNGKTVPRWSIRDNLLKWKGYKLMQIQIKPGACAPPASLKGMISAAREIDEQRKNLSEFRGPAGDGADGKGQGEVEADDNEGEADADDEEDA